MGPDVERILLRIQQDPALIACTRLPEPWSLELSAGIAERYANTGAAPPDNVIHIFCG